MGQLYLDQLYLVQLYLVQLYLDQLCEVGPVWDVGSEVLCSTVNQTPVDPTQSAGHPRTACHGQYRWCGGQYRWRGGQYRWRGGQHRWRGGQLFVGEGP